jgi:superfamily I DNA and/or RNA helicase
LQSFPHSQAELEQWLALLKQELHAKQTYYREKTLRTPLEKRVREGTTWYPVQLGKLGYTTGEHLKLTLTKTNPDRVRSVFQGGQMVSVFSNQGGKPEANPSLTAVVAKVTPDEMTVVVSRSELPGWMHEPDKLGIDLYFDETSFREMERAVNQAIRTKDEREQELRDVLLGVSPAQFAVNNEQQTVNRDGPWGGSLNPSQAEAIALIERTRDVCVVHCPPGTGKTTTLVAAIQHTLQTEPQVLVCAPSNTAVDVLTEGLARAGVRVLRLGHPVRVSEDLQRHTVDFQIANHRDYTELKRLRRKAQDLFAKAGKWKRTYVRGQRQDEQREARQLLDDAKVLEEFILFDVLRTAQAVTCTLVGATARILGKREFHTVFIDEAAQALAPACLIPIQRAQRVVFAGDHCQLPPTVKSPEAAKGGLGESLMERTLKRQLTNHRVEVDVMLRTQYRMHRAIMAFSNQEFYHGGLEAHESVAERSLVAPEQHPELARPMVWVDTAGCGHDEEQHPESLSRFNIEEANLLLAHLHRTVVDFSSLEPERGLSIGILTPYKAQAQQLEQRLRELGLRHAFQQHTFNIDTVDGFQGQERDVIYCSLVRSNPRGEVGFLGDVRRLNVAMTRARSKLVLIGDSATVTQHPFFARLLAHCEATGAYTSAWELVSIATSP